MREERAPRNGRQQEQRAPALDRRQSILSERARRLAMTPPQRADARETVEVVTFSLGEGRYAFEARYVLQVGRLADLTPVPGTPQFVAGVTNQRGELLAVVDLRRFLDLPTRGLTDLLWLVVLGVERAELGVLADAAHELVRVPIDELRKPTTDANVGRTFVRGVTRDAVVVLDTAALLRDERLFVGTHDPADGGEETRGDGA